MVLSKINDANTTVPVTRVQVSIKQHDKSYQTGTTGHGRIYGIGPQKNRYELNQDRNHQDSNFEQV